jgi:hypothetical protein
MFLVPLTLPPRALVLLGLGLHIGNGELMLSLLAFVGDSALLAAVFRHLALLLAVLTDPADFDFFVFFAIGQILILTLPALLTPIYRRLMAAEG